MRPLVRAKLTLGVFLLGVTACSGKVGDYLTPPGARGFGAPGPGTASGFSADGKPCSQERALAPARIWQLTDEQYVTSVRQVFDVSLVDADAEITQPAGESGEYTNLSELSQVGTPAAKGYRTAAKKVAAQAVMKLTSLLPCKTDKPDAACIRDFLRTRVARAYRRALADVEVDDLMAVYDGAAQDGPVAGVSSIIEAVLQSPSFVYRTELGTSGGGASPPTGPVQLGPYEIASALSFTFTESPPDDALWSNAQSGMLQEPPVLAAEVERLMALPEARATLTKKATYWLGVEKVLGTSKDSALFPAFTADLRNALHESAMSFVNDVVWNGKVFDLLSSRRVYVNGLLAQVYDVPGISGDAMVAIEVTTGQRSAGILTQPAVLAAFSRPNRGDPIHRGLFVYNNLLCGVSVGSPPAGALDVAAKMMGTERELAGLRAANGVCKGCHGRFDPLGLTTERYDPMGRYFETSSAGPVDSTSVIAGLGQDLDGPISGVDDLASRLGSGRRVSDCGAIYLATYALGRDFKADDSCTFAAVKDKLATTGSLGDFFTALVTSPAFVTRDPNLIVK
jgi:Protein of unknown function (DUF1592)/Protein of unknown function (DUF1588)/Protein of unknown function (DUF1595)/Protein of unknown function (DUF1585)